MKPLLFGLSVVLLIFGCELIPEAMDPPPNEIVIMENITQEDTLAYDLDSLFINSVSDHETPAMISNSDTSKVLIISLDKEQILFFGKAVGSTVIKFHVSEKNILSILYFKLTVDPCPTELLDCLGKCNGTAEFDSCGVRCGDNTTCADCAGVPNGDSLEDNCGTCDSDSSNDCEQDCAGEWGGNSEYDICLVCGGDETSEENCIVDCPEGETLGCDNICESSGDETQYDDCSVCGGNNTTCADCAGVPYGDSWVSDCGCVAADNDGNDCDDCFGTPHGTAWDSDCGCVAADNSGDECDDCAGVPNGDSLEDNCGVCDDIPSNNCEVAKAILVEVFTNDGCTPCVPVNHLLDVLFEDYNENITMIRYHWNSPNPVDPMYLDNPEDVELRRQMYSVLFCPVAVVNGIHISNGQSLIESHVNGDILTELANESILYLGHEVSLDNDIIVVDLEIRPFEIINGPVKSWAVVVEDSIDHEGYNGETIHMQVMRDLAEGEQWSVLESDSSYSTSISLIKPEGYSDANTLFHIVTMIQNTETNQVIQSNRLHAPLN